MNKLYTAETLSEKSTHTLPQKITAIFNRIKNTLVNTDKPYIMKTNDTLQGLIPNNNANTVYSVTKQQSGAMLTVGKHLVNSVAGVFLVVLLMMGGLVNAQSVANYGGVTNFQATSSAGAFAVITGATVPSGMLVDDAISAAIPIGFDFYFNGLRYTQVQAGTDGYLSLNTTGTSGSAISNNLATGATVTRPVLAPFWDDMDGRGTTPAAKASYVTTGSVGSRVFTFEWLNWVRTGGGAGGAVMSFQVKLFEGTGVIRYIYRSDATALSGASASIGLSAVGSGSGTFVSLNNAGATPTTSTTTETATISTKPATDQIYTFTPPGNAGSTVTSLAAPTAINFTSITGTGMTVNWTAASPTTGITKYAIYNSSDGGTTYNFVNTTNLGTNTLAVTGLTASTSYLWRVYSLSEGCLSAPLSGTQATTTTYTSVVANGDWNTPATWSPAAVPTAGSAVIINTNVTSAATPTNQVSSITVNNGFTLTLNGTYTNPSGSAVTVASGGTLAVGANYTNTGTTTINGTFQINNSGFGGGAGTWTYGAAGTLIFNTSSLYGAIDAGHTYWPSASGPFNVTVQNSGGINLSVARTVAGTFQTTAQVTGSSAVTCTGTCQINAGGYFSTTPTYGAASTLIYATANTSGTPYGVGSEWTGSSTTAGSGIPNNVTLNNNTFITMPNGNRGMAGAFNVTSGSGITLNATAGDLGVAGNFTQNGTFTNSGRAVNFFGTSATTQTISGSGLNTGSGTNCFAYFVISNTNAAGVTIGTNVTIDAAAGDVLQFLNTGQLKIGAFTLTVNGNGGNILVNGTTGGTTKTIDFTSASGILRIIGTTGTLKTVTSTASGVLSITSSVAGGQVQVQSGGFDPGSGLTTIQTGAILTINTGGYIANNSATYATGSTLSFRTTAGYGVNNLDKTWAIGTSGAGVPDKVEINAASTNVSINEDRTARSTLTVTAGTLTNNTNVLNVATTITTAATAVSINGGTLTNGGGTINIGASGGGNQALSLSSGSLTLGSGTINLNGNYTQSGGTITQTGGLLAIDGNSGISVVTPGLAATSVASGTHFFTTTTAATLNCSAGTIRIVDPPFSTYSTSTTRVISISQSSSLTSQFTGTHTFEIGDGASSTVGNTDGFVIETYSSSRCALNNLTINAGNGTGRWASSSYSGSSFGTIIHGTLTINANSEFRNNLGGSAPVFIIKGNIVNNGILTSTQTIRFRAIDATGAEVSNTTAQTVSGSGTYRNLTTSPTAKFTSLLFDNTAAGSAVTFSIADVTLTGTATLTSGIIDVGNNNSFNFVTSTSAVSGGSATAFVLIQGTGQMKKDFASGGGSFTYNIGENTGTTEYSPASLNFTAMSPASTIGVRPVDGATASTGHPNVNDVDVQTDYISRWWQVSNSAATTYTYTGTFQYVAADINGTQTNMKVNLWNGASPWKQALSSAASNVLTISSGLTEITGPLTSTAEFTGRLKGAQTYTWNQTGTAAYGTAANWTPTRSVASADDILVFDGTPTPTPTVTGVPTETIGKLLFTNSANVIFQSAAAVTYTISGGTGTDLDIPVGSHLQVGSTGANSINLAFTGAQTASIAGQLSLLTNTSNNNTYTATNSVTTVTGTINSSGTIASTTSNLLFTTGTYNHTFPATGVTANLPAIPTATWTANTSLCTITGLTSPTAGTFPSGLTGQTFGNFTWNTPSLSTAPNIGGGTITSVGTFTMTSTGTAALRLGTGASGTIVCTNYTQTGGTIDMASGAGAGTIRTSGTFNQSGGTITETSTGNGTLEFNGASSQSVTTGGTISNTINVTVSNPTGIAVAGTLAMNAGTTFTAASSGTAVTSGTVSYSTTTTLAYVTAVGAQTTGNEFPATNGPVNVTFNNTNAARTITLSAARTVTGTLTLTGGRVTLGLNDLTLANGGTLAATSPSVTNMIVTNGAGLFKRGIPATTGTYLFPIGETTGTTQYSPVSLQFTANSIIRIIGAKVIDGVSSNMNTPSAPTNYLSRYWTFSENGAGGTYNYYINPALAITGSEDEVGTASLITPAYWNGSVWTVSAGTYNTGTGNLVSNATGVSETAAPLGTVEWTGRATPPVSYTWVGFTDGSWTTAANWSPSGVPGSSDAVTIANGSTGANTNLNLTTAVTVNAITFNGTFTVGAAGAITAGGNVTYTAGTGTWNSASTFTISSSSSQTIPPFTYGNLNCTGGNRVWTGAATTGIAGTFTPGAGTYTATANSTVDYSGAAGQNIQSVNYFNLTNSSNTARTTLSGTIDIAGSYTPTTAVTTMNSSNVVNFSSAGAQTIPTSTYTTITNTGNGNRTLAATGANTNVITISSGFTPGSGTYTTTGSTIEYTSISSSNVLSVFPYYNLKLNSAGSGVWSLASGITLAIANDLTIAGTSSTSTLNVSNTASTNVLNVGGNLIIQDKGRFNVAGANSTGATANITGNLTISGTGRISLESVSSSTGVGVINVSGNFISTGTSVASGGAGGIVDFGITVSTVTNNAINIAGNFDKSGVGTFGTNATGTPLGFVFNKNGTQTFSYAGATSQYTPYVVGSTSTLQMLTGHTLPTGTSPTSNFTVNGVLDLGTNVITAGNTTDPVFTLAAGATLKTANANGVSGSFSGFTSGTTLVLAAGAKYEFNSNTASQNMGFTGLTFGLPNSITVSNTFGTVTPDVNITFGNTATLNVNAGATLVAAAARTFTFGTGGVVNVDGTLRTANITATGALAGSATSTIVSTNSPTINLNSGSTVVYNGAAAQFATARTFAGLTIDNSAGLTMLGNISATALGLTAGTLSLGTNTLTINGAVTGSGTLTGSAASTLVIGGTAGTLNFTSGARTLKSLTLNAGATASLGTALDIAAGTFADPGTVTIGGVSSALLTTNNNLTLKSDAFGIARVAANTSGSTYISGNVTVERYLKLNTANGRTGKAWRLLTSPVTGTNVNAAWQQGMYLYNANGSNSGTTNYVIGSNNLTSATPTTGYGTLITGGIYANSSAANALGFDWWDAIKSSTSSIRHHSSNTTLNILTPGQWLTPGNTTSLTFNNIYQGYLLFVRGDRTSPATISATTLRATGALNQGLITPNLVRSGLSQFTLIANPYASPIDFEAIFNNNNAKIMSRFTIWDANLNLTGGYRLVTRNNSNDYTITPGGPQSNLRYIQSGQAFFVEASTDNTNTFDIPESAKVALGDDAVFFQGGDNNGAQDMAASKGRAGEASLNINLNIKNADNSILLADGALLTIGAKYNKAVTGEDARKAYNFSENLAIAVDTFNLISERRPPLGKVDTVFLKLWGTGIKNYQFDIWSSALKGRTANLVDKYLGTSTPLTLDGSVNSIGFSITSDVASKDINRFYIVTPGTGAAIIAGDINGEESAATKGSVGMKAYPNPATGSRVNVLMSNLPKGIYELSAFTLKGTKMLTRKIEHTGGNLTESITLANWSAGVYTLQLTDANGIIVKTVSVVVSR